jgi:hypothetical protein
MEGLNTTAIPLDFASAIRITLESVKISRLIDMKTSTNLSNDQNTTPLGLLKMLESNLNVLADSMRTEDANFSSMTEFSLLMAKLNLCSFGLNQATKLTTPEATQLRLSAFSCTKRLIQLFIATPFIAAQGDGISVATNVPMQTYYPRAYWRGLAYACLALLKLSVTKALPKPEIIQSENTIKQAVELFSACSTTEGDELYRAARLIRFLGQEAVQEIIQPRHEVKSRMGASLIYDMIMSALALRKRKEAEQREDSRNWLPQSNSLIGENASRVDTTFSMSDFSMSDVSPRAMDEWIASSGYLLFDPGFHEKHYPPGPSSLCFSLTRALRLLLQHGIEWLPPRSSAGLRSCWQLQNYPRKTLYSCQ